MHVGLSYPWHFEVWPVSGLWWPGFVPRRVKVRTGSFVPLPFSGFSDDVFVSGIGIPSPDRESVQYDLPLDVNRILWNCVVRSYLGPEGKIVEVRLNGVNGEGDFFSTFEGDDAYHPWYTYGPGFPINSFNGVPLPIPVVTNSTVDALNWVESDPPADNRNLGRWLRDG